MRDCVLVLVRGVAYNKQGAVMGTQTDRFTWAVIGVIVTLLIMAIISVNLSGDQEPPAYLEEDTPAAPVYNAFLALQEGDATKARSYYSDNVFAGDDGPSLPPVGSYPSPGARRLRITDIHVDESNPDRALVTFTLDSYYPSGLFGSGSTGSYEGMAEVVREEGVWKLNSFELFY